MPKKKRVGAIPKPKIGQGGGKKPGRLNKTGKKKRKAREHDERRLLQAHGSKESKDAIRRKLRIEQLQRALGQEEAAIRAYVTPEDRERRKKTDLEFAKMKKERLHGAPRPAWSREKSGHGCGYDWYECHDTCGDFQNAPTTRDLFATAVGELASYPEARGYCRCLHHLGRALRSQGMSGEAVGKLQELLKLDPTDAVRARYSLLSSLIDEGSLGEARALVDQFPDDDSTPFLYARAIIEYIAFTLLEEEDSSEEAANAALDKALAANPFAGAMLGAHGAFAELVDPNVSEQIELAWDARGEDGEGQDAFAGSVEEAVWWCAREVGCWIDADGACDWVAGRLADPSPSPGEEDPSDRDYLDLYAAVMERAEEMAAEEEGGGEGGEEE